MKRQSKNRGIPKRRRIAEISINPICRRIWESAINSESSVSEDSSSNFDQNFPSFESRFSNESDSMKPPPTVINNEDEEKISFRLKIRNVNPVLPLSPVRRGQLNLVACASDGKLTVTILGLKSLAISFTEKNPVFVYVKLSLYPDLKRRVRFKTSLQKITSFSAVLHETFTFDLINSVPQKRLLISVWCKTEEEQSATFIGCMSFGLKNFVKIEQILHGWYYLLHECLGRKKHLKVREKYFQSRSAMKGYSSLREKKALPILQTSCITSTSECSNTDTDDENFRSLLPQKSSCISEAEIGRLDRRKRSQEKLSNRRCSLDTQIINPCKRRKSLLCEPVPSSTSDPPDLPIEQKIENMPLNQILSDELPKKELKTVTMSSEDRGYRRFGNTSPSSGECKEEKQIPTALSSIVKNDTHDKKNDVAPSTYHGIQLSPNIIQEKNKDQLCRIENNFRSPDHKTDKTRNPRRSMKLWLQQTWPSSDKKTSTSDIDEKENFPRPQSPAKPRRKSGFWKNILGESEENLESFSFSNVKHLQDVLQHKESLAAFRKFLTHEYSEENLDFWLECKEFKLVKDSKYRKVAAKIYDRFIASGSEKEVNITSDILKSIKNKLSCPTKDIFDEAQHHIYQLMETDSLRRFLSSSLASSD